MSCNTHYNQFARHHYLTFAIGGIFLLLLFVFSFPFATSLTTSKNNTIPSHQSVYLAGNVDEELIENIDKQLEDIDLKKLDDEMSTFGNLEIESIGSTSFVEIVKKFLNGENDTIYTGFLSFAINVLFSDLLEFIPFFAIIITLCIAFSLIGHFGSDKSNISTTIFIILFCSISVIVLKMVLSLINSATSAINSMQNQLEGLFPILLTLITAIGSTATATTFQPMLAIFTSGISKIFSYLLIPLFIFSIVFAVIGNISKNVKLDKFSKFFSSVYNYTIGILFTTFMAFLTIHGLNVSTMDSISLKTAKFAIKSYVPMVGGYLADGVSIILASSVLIKNAIGISGLVIMIFKIFAPIVSIMLVILLLRLSSAILEPICDKAVSDFLYSISKSLVMIIVALLAVGLMYIISISMLLSCSNLL